MFANSFTSSSSLSSSSTNDTEWIFRIIRKIHRYVDVDTYKTSKVEGNVNEKYTKFEKFGAIFFKGHDSNSVPQKFVSMRRSFFPRVKEVSK